MDEVKTGNSSSSTSRVSSSYIKAGNRQLFSVELRPGETTIVSWKKLLKDANKATSGSTSVPGPFTSPPAPAPDLGVAPAAEPEAENAAPPNNRFSAVIEKIERLYMGKDSSDEEDLGDIPDDDQYDTEDSFIDDAELDEYFEVDNAATKHDGFFVNRGKLEYSNDPAALPNQQPKKRRRKDPEKGNNEKAEGLQRNKHVKVGKSSEKAAAVVGKNSSNYSYSLTSSEPYQDTRYQDERKIQLDYAPVNYGNTDSTISLAETKSAEKQKMVQKNLTKKFKDPSGSAEKGALASLKSPAGRSLNNANEIEVSHGPRERNTIREVPDLNMPDGKHAAETSKASNPHRKDGAGVRPKSSMLEKAIRELEKMVAESRPPATENHEADISSQAVKRRLPNEVKLKLAKVARLAQSSHGKISKELINRLMSIVGHLIQLRTLKRNLKIMVSMGLTAKQEKESRFQQIKKEVADMVNMRVSPLDTKALEQRAMASNDFQEYSSEEKGLQKRKFDMDAAMEDKICALYDLYVDGLDEDTGPQVRKLYSELAALWPSGLMDNHGIKRAICRAKERQRAMYSKYKDQDKITKKKMLTPKVEDAVQTEGGSTSLAQLQHSRERLMGDSTNQHSSIPINKSSPTIVATAQVPSPTNPTLEMVKQERGKGSSGQLADDPRLGDDALPKKKPKKKPEVDLNVMPCSQEKLPSQQGDEQLQSTQQALSLPNKLSLQPTSAPSFGHSS